MAKEPKDYPFIVWLTGVGDAGGGARWNPQQPSADLEATMVPAYQRGGLTGQFQTLGDPSGAVRVSFVPWHQVAEVETRKSFEDRQKAPVRAPQE